MQCREMCDAYPMPCRGREVYIDQFGPSLASLVVVVDQCSLVDVDAMMNCVIGWANTAKLGGNAGLGLATLGRNVLAHSHRYVRRTRRF